MIFKQPKLKNIYLYIYKLYIIRTNICNLMREREREREREKEREIIKTLEQT